MPTLFAAVRGERVRCRCRWASLRLGDVVAATPFPVQASCPTRADQQVDSRKNPEVNVPETPLELRHVLEVHSIDTSDKLQGHQHRRDDCEHEQNVVGALLRGLMYVVLIDLRRTFVRVDDGPTLFHENAGVVECLVQVVCNVPEIPDQILADVRVVELPVRSQQASCPPHDHCKLEPDQGHLVEPTRAHAMALRTQLKFQLAQSCRVGMGHRHQVVGADVEHLQQQKVCAPFPQPGKWFFDATPQFRHPLIIERCIFHVVHRMPIETRPILSERFVRLRDGDHRVEIRRPGAED
mmetsp:Transcript_37751/g.120341  ORF Transcript_37751/g.120341 Transcript_37751/m.120341 type:complete len:295 (-) Transcript_37751:1165-2049(-)